MAREVNFDGLIGPTHNYAGLSRGNIASSSNAGQASSPRAAALQGLDKMRFMTGLGMAQGVLPPQARPDLDALRRLGFSGDDEGVLRAAGEADPTLLAAAWSASSMWAANAATVSPSPDTADGKVHLTPANLVSNLHRSFEPPATARVLRRIFSNPDRFTVHDPLPPQARFADEGAANHTRFAPTHDRPGVELFVYGSDSGADSPAHASPRLPARQTRAACEAVARLHRLDPARVVFARQHPDAVDSGVFHNDVIATGNGGLFLFHEGAFADTAGLVRSLADAAAHAGHEHAPVLIQARGSDFSLRDAVAGYLFNSQVVTLPDGSMALIAPVEARENPRKSAFVDRVVADPANPIRRTEYTDVRESMRNGGGPACLRLRVVLSDAELVAVHPGVMLTDSLYHRLVAWVGRHYPDRLTPADLTDPCLARACLDALDELTGILDLPDLYPFQR